jgi:hypothetical protein
MKQAATKKALLPILQRIKRKSGNGWKQETENLPLLKEPVARTMPDY